MNDITKKVLVVFPHSPNPRMIKRVRVLLSVYDVHVIYWDRDLGNKKINELPMGSKVKVVKRKANEGSPLKRIGTTIRVIKEVVSIAKEISPDIIYLSKTDMLFAGFLYKKLIKTNTPLIYEVSDLHTLMIDIQNKVPKKLISLILKKVERSMCKSIALLVVTSEYFYESFYRSIVSEDNVVFIPNTPDPRVFENFKRKTHEKFTVGFIGAVRYAEQLEMLIDASVEAGVNVFIAGGGKDYIRIKEYAKNFDNVEIYGEYEYEQEIKELYERVDCIYSVYDTKLTNVQLALPNRLYEAAFTATPIIAPKNTYLGDLVEKYGIGNTVLSDSKSELTQLLLKIKKDSKYFHRLEEKSTHLKGIWNLNEYNKELIEAIERNF